MVPESNEEHDAYQAFKAAVKDAARAYEHLDARADVVVHNDGYHDNDTPYWHVELLVVIRAEMRTAGLALTVSHACAAWEHDTSWQCADRTMDMELKTAPRVIHFYVGRERLGWDLVRPVDVTMWWVRIRQSEATETLNLLTMIRACMNNQVAYVAENVISAS
jgi:hypothetical protein